MRMCRTCFAMSVKKEDKSLKNRNMIFDFTQCYPKRKEPGLEWHDCSAIGGSRLYCSRDAEEKIKALIAPAGVSGIHFIDLGIIIIFPKL